MRLRIAAAFLGLVLRSEEREIQKSRLALARDKFEFNAAKAALAELPNLKHMSQEDAAREEERVRAIKWRLFGTRTLRERKVA